MTPTQHLIATQAQRLIPEVAELFALHRIANQDWKPAVRPPVNLDTGQMLLARHAKALLGLPAGKRSAPIMVTMPTEAATNPTLVRDLLAARRDGRDAHQLRSRRPGGLGGNG